MRFDNDMIIAFANQCNGGWDYYEFTDRTNEVKTVGPDELRGSDGHCSYSIDNKWMLTDDYPAREKKDSRRLYLFNNQYRKLYELGEFYCNPSLPIPMRCDLHPNWSRDCTQVCFDSIHEGTRHIYIMDFTALTR